MEGEVAAADDDVVEVLVHPLPREVEQSELLECLVHRLPRGKPTHIVQSRVVVHPASAEALHAAPRLVGAFKDENLHPSLGEQCAALQAAQAAADNQDIVHLIHNY